MKKLRSFSFTALCVFLMSTTGCALFNAVFDPNGDSAKEREKKRAAAKYEFVMAVDNLAPGELIYSVSHDPCENYDKIPKEYREIFLAWNKLVWQDGWFEVRNKRNNAKYYLYTEKNIWEGMYTCGYVIYKLYKYK